ncbi:MAG: heavy metal transporter [Lutibacter sp.]|nr:MAG: heavy metal transporter [Lutibacter sp.]
MSTDKQKNKLVGMGILSAVAASLCCITPVLALFAGTTSMAASFSWIEPFRPYLIVLTIVVLAFAWYQKIKSSTKEKIECACEEDEKQPFMQSKTFLGIVTIFSIVMLAFPYYADIFYPNTKKEVIIVNASNIKTVEFDIVGMTCSGCAEMVNFEVNKLEGIINSNASYENSNAIIEFDISKTSENEIEKTINSTGYTVPKTNN